VFALFVSIVVDGGGGGGGGCSVSRGVIGVGDDVGVGDLVWRMSWHWGLH